MFYNEEIAESCPDSSSDKVDESDTTVYLSNSLNYITYVLFVCLFVYYLKCLFRGLGSGWLGNVWEKAKEKVNNNNNNK